MKKGRARGRDGIASAMVGVVTGWWGRREGVKKLVLPSAYGSRSSSCSWIGNGVGEDMAPSSLQTPLPTSLVHFPLVPFSSSSSSFSYFALESLSSLDPWATRCLLLSLTHQASSSGQRWLTAKHLLLLLPLLHAAPVYTKVLVAGQ